MIIILPSILQYYFTPYNDRRLQLWAEWSLLSHFMAVLEVNWMLGVSKTEVEISAPPFLWMLSVAWHHIAMMKRPIAIAAICWVLTVCQALCLALYKISFNVHNSFIKWMLPLLSRSGNCAGWVLVGYSWSPSRSPFLGWKYCVGYQFVASASKALFRICSVLSGFQ